MPLGGFAPPPPARFFSWERKQRAAGAGRQRIQRKRSGGRGRSKGRRLGRRAARRGRCGPPPRTPQGPQGQNTRAHSTICDPKPQRQVHEATTPGAHLRPALRALPGPAPRAGHPRFHSPRTPPPGHPSPAPGVSPARPTPATKYAALPTGRTACRHTSPPPSPAGSAYSDTDPAESPAAPPPPHHRPLAHTRPPPHTHCSGRHSHTSVPTSLNPSDTAATFARAHPPTRRLPAPAPLGLRWIPCPGRAARSRVAGALPRGRDPAAKRPSSGPRPPAARHVWSPWRFRGECLPAPAPAPVPARVMQTCANLLLPVALGPGIAPSPGLRPWGHRPSAPRPAPLPSRVLQRCLGSTSSLTSAAQTPSTGSPDHLGKSSLLF